MTADLFPDLHVVRASVTTAEGRKCTAQIAPVETDWMGAPVNLRKYTVRRLKLTLLQEGALCLACADSYKTYPPDCPLHDRLRVTYWDGRVAYPVTGDTLRTYAPSTRFNLIAAVQPELRPGRLRATTSYAALELQAPEWLGLSLAARHQRMREVVDRLGPGAGAPLRTLIFDGKREHPYTFNWAAVQVDQSR